jgi:hypothetical protein
MLLYSPHTSPLSLSLSLSLLTGGPDPEAHVAESCGALGSSESPFPRVRDPRLPVGLGRGVCVENARHRTDDEL